MRYLTRLAFVLSSILFVSATNADHVVPRLIVVGNSISTTHHSWPNVLGDLSDRWAIHVMAQNGRTIRDFSFPRDLWTAGNQNDTVVYFLGGNDILQRNHVDFAKYRLQLHANFLLQRNFKVLLVMPPNFGLDEEMFGESNRQHRKIFEDLRGTHPRLWVYDIDAVWDPAGTSDGIHPDDELSYEIAQAINWVLAMNIY
ncbi:MAG: SGNH/GDSL hydrolase family protein [Halioglobus sp.]